MAIEIRNVCKSFKDVNVVQNVNLMVESGESVVLLGPTIGLFGIGCVSFLDSDFLLALNSTKFISAKIL